MYDYGRMQNTEFTEKQVDYLYRLKKEGKLKISNFYMDFLYRATSWKWIRYSDSANIVKKHEKPILNILSAAFNGDYKTAQNLIDEDSELLRKFPVGITGSEKQVQWANKLIALFNRQIMLAIDGHYLYSEMIYFFLDVYDNCFHNAYAGDIIKVLKDCKASYSQYNNQYFIDFIKSLKKHPEVPFSKQLLDEWEKIKKKCEKIYLYEEIDNSDNEFSPFELDGLNKNREEFKDIDTVNEGLTDLVTA